MNTQTNSENTSVKIPSLPSLFLHLYPSQTLHHSHTTPKRRFLSLSHRSFHSHSKPIRPANLIPFSESHSLFLPFRSPFHAHHSSHPFPASFSIPSDSSKSNPLPPPSPLSSLLPPSPHTPPQSPPIQSIHHSQSELTLSTPTPPTIQPLLPTPNQRTSSMVSTFTPFCQLTIAYR